MENNNMVITEIVGVRSELLAWWSTVAVNFPAL